ncbi:MAG: aldo/keto reductase [Chloroflexota bacterium]|jgi:hypothetical protein|nr:aldo/keto reductase [Chloroflexota bacterium]
MEQRRLGKSGLTTSAIGFGTWEMGGTNYGEIDESEAIEAVHSALDNGITLFDTAAVYGPRFSEILLAKALGNRRKDIVLVTKVGFRWDDEGNVPAKDASWASVTEGTEECLQRLETDWIDLLLIHWPDHKTPTEETIGALEDLKSVGKIREYGVSNYDVPMMETCARYGTIAANQIGYHMFDRRVEAKVFDYCREQDLGFMGYGTLAFGILTGAFTPDTTFEPPDWRSQGLIFGDIPTFEREHFLTELRVVERLKEFAAGSDHTVAQLAISWVLSRPEVSVALVGARKPSEVEENVAAVDWRITSGDKAEIDRIFEGDGCRTFVDLPQAT